MGRRDRQWFAVQVDLPGSRSDRYASDDVVALLPRSSVLSFDYVRSTWSFVVPRLARLARLRGNPGR